MSHPVKVLPLALALAIGSGSAFALGLGPIEVKSQLNQPLLAEIPVIGADPADLEALDVRLAAPEAFERIGLPAPAGVTANLEFSVGRNARGEPVVRVTTANRIADPFVSFLLQADWGKGSVVREFTVLVDPPHIAAATVTPVRAATVAAPAAPTPAPSPVSPPTPAPAEPVAAPEAPTAALSAPEPATKAEPIAPGPAPAPAPASPPPPSPVAAPPPPPVAPAPPPAPPPAAPSSGEHRVGSGDTLWSIAAERRGSVSAAQMMLAIQRANPEAFVRGNINLLRKGAVLRIPTSAQAEALARNEAEARVREQMVAWRALSGAPAPTPTPVEGERVTTASTPASPSTLQQSRIDSPAPSAGPTRPPAGRLEIAPPSGAGAAAAQSGAAAGGAGSELRAELQQAREDLSARDAELRELQSRLAEQESLANERKRLIELKDSQLSALEEALRREREGQGAAPAEPEAAMPPAPASTPAPAQTPPSTVGAPVHAPTESGVPWWRQPWVLGAGGLVLVGGLVGLLLRRRRGAGKAFAPVSTPSRARLSEDPDFFAGLPAVDAEPESPPRASSASGTQPLPVSPDVEPGVETAAGAYSGTSEIVDEPAQVIDAGPVFAPLREEVSMTPSDLDVHVALLRQLYSIGDATGFLAAAEAMHPHVAENGDPRWREVVVMGMGLVPGHPLFREVLWNPVRSADVQTRDAAPTPAPTEPVQERAEVPLEADAFDAAVTARREAMDVAPSTAEGLDDTRLELAKAYIEIGDADGARGMLEEVLAEGHPAARAEAARLLAQLG